MTAKYCFRFGVYWRGITHDLSKLLPDEWLPYVRHFYTFGPKHAETESFKRAWLKHIHRNDHHPYYWVLDDGSILDMPEDAIREMVADWHGAAAAQNKPETSVWYWYFWDNRHLMPLSYATRERVDQLVSDIYWQGAPFIMKGIR